MAIVDLIDNALKLLEVELEAAKRSEPTVDSVSRLTFMKQRLDAMRTCVVSGIREGEGHKGTMTRMIIDTWPLDHPAGCAISDAEYYYYHKGS